MNAFNQLEAGYLIRSLISFLSNIVKSFEFGLSPIAFLLPISLICLLLVALLIRRLLAIRSDLKKKAILLELTPPARTEKTAYTTQQLFSVIHSLGERKTLVNKLLGLKTLFSFEIVSSANQGIRFLIRTTPNEAGNIKRYLLSYLPQVSVKTVDDYLSQDIERRNEFQTKVVEYKLKRHFAYPLQNQESLTEHDPVAYITGMMTKLAPSELVSFQIVLSPNQSREVLKIKGKALKGGDVLDYLEKGSLFKCFRFLQAPFYLFALVLKSVLSTIAWAFKTLFNDLTGVRTPTYTYEDNFKKVDRQLNTFDTQAVNSIKEKIEQQLFEAKIRLLVVVEGKKSLAERVRGFTSSLAVFAVLGYQSIQRKRSLKVRFLEKLHFLSFKYRLLSLLSNSSSDLLSISEISDLFHFPYTKVTQTENIVKIHSKELPAPLSLKKQQIFDVTFAKNTYGGATTNIGLLSVERLRHMYIIGATGTGKTTMILSMASQDIKNGKGVCVIDPHGDLAESLLTEIPDTRIKDLIYFNPDDIRYPIGVNLLELTPGLDEDDQLREKELITESVISLFRKIFSEVWSAHAHRLEYILRNTIQTALTLKNPTLFTVYDLLTNPEYQKKVTNSLEDENLKNFWKYEFGKAGDYQKVKMIGPVTSRIGRFLFSPSAKRILEQEKSTINFDEIMDQGKILICNLSKGKIGEDTSEVLGILILTKIQLSTLKRARFSNENRKPFYLYVDEFQNFATPSFIQMLSEARKYNLNLVMAEQSTSQQKDRNLVNVVLANVGTVVSFRSANPEDEKLMLPQYSPYVEQGEISNLPSFHFYAKISAINPEEPFSGETVPVEIKFDKRRVESIIDSSRNLYAILYKKPEIKQPKVSKKEENSAPSVGSLT